MLGWEHLKAGPGWSSCQNRSSGQLRTWLSICMAVRAQSPPPPASIPGTSISHQAPHLPCPASFYLNPQITTFPRVVTSDLKIPGYIITQSARGWNSVRKGTQWNTHSNKTGNDFSKKREDILVSST